MRPRLLAVLAIAPLYLGCSDDNTQQQNDKTTRLSDADGDGMFMSEGCTSADPADDCVILPGPAECSYLEVTVTTTVIIDAAGNVVSESTTECVKCLAEDFSVISESCGGSVPPVICEPIPYATPAGEADAAPGYGGGGSGGSPGAGECWWCHSEDGSTSYIECVDPTWFCYSDADCPSGYHCDYGYYPPPCDPSMDPSVPCPATDTPAGEPRIAVAGGQCVPDAPTYCSTDEECPDGYYCEFYYDCSSDPMAPCSGGGAPGSDGSGAAPDALWYGGQCVPVPPPPPPSCTVDADCGDGGVCVVYCDDFTGDCKGYCEWYMDPCNRYWTAEECSADLSCVWTSYGGGGGFADVPCYPDGSGGCGGGYCSSAPTDPPPAP